MAQNWNTSYNTDCHHRLKLNLKKYSMIDLRLNERSWVKFHPMALLNFGRRGPSPFFLPIPDCYKKSKNKLKPIKYSLWGGVKVLLYIVEISMIYNFRPPPPDNRNSPCSSFALFIFRYFLGAIALPFWLLSISTKAQ